MASNSAIPSLSSPSPYTRALYSGFTRGLNSQTGRNIHMDDPALPSPVPFRPSFCRLKTMIFFYINQIECSLY